MTKANKIPLLSELIDAYQDGKITANGSAYKVYLTELRKKNNSIGWIHDSEFEGFLKIRKDSEKLLYDLLWNQ